MAAGILVVWSGHEPRLDTFRIGDGLDFGRANINPSTDDRISNRHARFEVDGSRVTVTDLGSRNGSFVAGEVVVDRSQVTTMPAMVRMGRTLVVVVADVRPHEHVPLSRRGALVVGGSLDAPLRALDLAAVDAANVAIVGSRSVALGMAAIYGAALGGDVVAINHARFEEGLGEKRPRTIILALDMRLGGAFAELIAEWLETDVRFVTLVPTRAELAALPAAIAPRLAERAIEIPHPRFDELPMVLRDIVTELVPGARLHTSAIEYALIRAAEIPDEDEVLARFRNSIVAWRDQSSSLLRGSDLEQVHATPMNYVIFPGSQARRRRDRL